MPIELFTCSTCDARVAGKGTGVPLGNKPDSTVIYVCKRCSVTIRSYETMRAMEAGEYDEVLWQSP